MRVRYLPEAEADYLATAAWYEEHSPGTGDDFVDAIERGERMIADLPRGWPQWPGAAQGIRRYLVPGTLFAIAYRVRADEIVVIAVAHQRRRPGFWSGRDPA